MPLSINKCSRCSCKMIEGICQNYGCEGNYMPEKIDVVELLAKQLHENFRAACKAMGIKHAPETHDHGYGDCGNKKKEYFRKRARLMLKRSMCFNPLNLGEAEQGFQARIFIRRAAVGLDTD